jgi:hypothetical protein
VLLHRLLPYTGWFSIVQKRRCVFILIKRPHVFASAPG